jgi:hypothetical protein
MKQKRRPKVLWACKYDLAEETSVIVRKSSDEARAMCRYYRGRPADGCRGCRGPVKYNLAVKSRTR